MEQLNKMDIIEEIRSNIKDLSKEDEEALLFLAVGLECSGNKNQAFTAVIKDDNFIYISPELFKTLRHKFEKCDKEALEYFNKKCSNYLKKPFISEISDGQPRTALWTFPTGDNNGLGLRWFFVPSGSGKIFSFGISTNLYYEPVNNQFAIYKKRDPEKIIIEYDFLNSLISAAIANIDSECESRHSIENALPKQLKRFEETAREELGINLGHWWSDSDFVEAGF